MTITQTKHPGPFTVEEIARAVRRTSWTIRLAIRTGALPSARVHGRRGGYIVCYSDLEKWLGAERARELFNPEGN